MSATATSPCCPECGIEIPSAAPEGLCPRCLALAIFDARSDATPEISAESFASHRFFGDYELLEEIGRGGSGIVFKARQLGVNRIVALKLLAAGAAAGRDFVHRFHTEAAAAARLDHPHIVPIYEFGEHEGAHFLAMRFIEGGTLQSRVASELPTLKEAAGLLIAVATAIEHAHQRGVLHRDLKPGNVLLDAEGSPHVTDFGLARLTEEDSSLTVSRAVLGTVAYLAPEIALHGAAAATIASDVYGLGAILYETLTGRVPFSGPTIATTLQSIQTEEPPKPSSFNPAISADLETICLKCLQKEPDKRYSTAKALADDLGCFLSNKAVQARPISRLEKAARWCRRKPALAAAVASTIVLALLLMASLGIAFFRISRERARAEEQASARRSQLYAAEVNLAFDASDQANLGQARQLLDRQRPSPGETNDLRGFEWRYLYAQCKGDELRTLVHSAELKTALCFAPVGRTLAIGDGDGNATLWDYQTSKKVAFFPAYTNFSRSIHVTERRALAFSADGKTLAIGVGNTIAIWDIASGQQTATLLGHTKAITYLAFAPNGGILASASDDATVRLWRVPSNLPESLVSLECPALAMAFSEDSSLLAVGSKAAVVMLWELSNPAAPRKLRSVEGMTGWVPGLAFSPAGRRLAAGSGSDVLLWELDAEGHAYSTNQFRNAGGWLGVIDSISFSPDGQVLVSVGTDRNLTLWDASGAGRAPIKLKGHQGEIYSVAFSNDGHFLASSSQDGTAKIWDSSSLWSRPQKMSHNNWLFAVAFSPDNRLLASFGQDSNVKLWDVASESLIAQRHFSSPDQRLSFSADGSLLALGDAGGVHLLRVSSLEDATNFPGHLISFSPVDGKLLYSQDQKIIQRDLQTGTVRSWNAQWDGAVSLAISPAGWLAAASPIKNTEQFRVRLWNLNSLDRSVELGRHADRVPGLSFSPDGTWLASASWDGTNRLWDLSKPGQPPISLPTQSGLAWAVAFSNDGRTLAAGGDDSALRLWHLGSFQQAATLRGHTASVTALAFSPDGKNLASGSGDGTVRIWRAPTLEEIILAETKRKQIKP